MKAAPFELHQPTSLDEALGLLAEHGDAAKALAGGQSLVPMLALRLARFDHLVDLNEIDQLTGTERIDGSLRLGSMTRHRSVEKDEAIGELIPLLARATRRVGHWQIRNRGTLGGSVAHADPAAEQPAVCLALDAIMEVRSRRGTRQIRATDFFQGTWATALGADELLVALSFPVWEGACGFGIEEIARRNGDFALAGVVCGVGLDHGRSRVERAAIALFGVGATPVRATEAEAALLAGESLDDVAKACTASINPTDDLHASGSYRRRVAGVLVRRAVTTALEEARRD
jgi:aerobic carbon-monoxide dehydrogenase medium subunit